MSEPAARIDVEPQGWRTLITVTGEVDLSNADELRRQAEASVREAQAVVIDLSAVEYLDSQGVRVLHDVARRLATEDVPLTVVAPSESIAGEVLNLVRMDASVRVCESLDDV
jgi:anti-anti-sigma factor